MIEYKLKLIKFVTVKDKFRWFFFIFWLKRLVSYAFASGIARRDKCRSYVNTRSRRARERCRALGTGNARLTRAGPRGCWSAATRSSRRWRSGPRQLAWWHLWMISSSSTLFQAACVTDGSYDKTTGAFRSLERKTRPFARAGRVLSCRPALSSSARARRRET